MSALPPETANFTADEQAEWNAWSTWSYTQSMQLVQMAQGTLSPSDDEAFVSLPGSVQPLNAKGTFTSNSSGTSVWWGQIQGQQGGHLAVTKNGSLTGITISQSSTTQLLFPISARYNVLITTIPSTTTYQELPHDIVGAGEPNTVPSCETFDDCQRTILATVLLTPEAIATLNPTGAPASSYQVFAATVFLAVGLQSINYALLNSGVPGKYVRFDVVNFNYPLSSESIDGLRLLYDLYGMTLIFPGASQSFADNIRDQYNSDIVILLTDDRYGPYAGYGDNEHGVAIVSANNLWASRFTFAHELGHIFGADHNRISNGGDAQDAAGRCNYGYNGTFGSSLMCYLPGAGRRNLLFSNPYIGTGTLQNNNAGYLSESMCSQPFYRSRQEATVSISGPSTVCATQGSVTYSANITLPGPGIPGTGPYTYTWRVFSTPSVALNATSAISGTDPTFTFNPSSANFPVQSNGEFWVHLTVRTASMVILTDIDKVVRINCNRSVSSPEADHALNAFTISPNPTNGIFRVSFEQNGDHDKGHYYIRNAFGQTLDQGALPAFRSTLDIDLQLPVGNYYFTIVQPEGTITKKFIIQN